MKCIEDINLSSFEFWSGAKDAAAVLTEKQFQTIEAVFEENHPEGMTATQINDIFWFEQDWLAEILGFQNWEQLEQEQRDEQA